MKKPNNATRANILLDVVEGYMNVSGKQATHIIDRFVTILTEDPVWLLKHIDRSAALDLINTLENFAHTGKRPKH